MIRNFSVPLAVLALFAVLVIPAHAACPDGVVDAEEQCDDNNSTNNDGCNSVCYIEPAWKCSGAPSSCTRGFDFGPATTAAGTAATDTGEFVMEQAVGVGSAVAAVGALVAVLIALLRGLGIRRKAGSVGGK